MLGDGLTAYSFCNPAGRLRKWKVDGLVVICPQSPLSWALEGKWSGCFLPEDVSTQPLGSYPQPPQTYEPQAVLFLLFSPKCLGPQLYASQDPPAGWVSATRLNWLKLKLTTKIHSFLLMLTSCHDQAQNSLESVSWFWISHHHLSVSSVSSQCNYKKYFGVSWEAEVCWTVVPWLNKEKMQQMTFVIRRSLINTSAPKGSPITAWLSTVISLQYSNQFVHLEKDKCWDFCTKKIWAYQAWKIRYNWMGIQICEVDRFCLPNYRMRYKEFFLT